MGFFDTIEIEDEAPATSSVQPSDDGTSIQSSTSSNFFSAVEFDEDDANTMPTSKPTVDTSHITDQDMYSFLSDIKASTMDEDIQAVDMHIVNQKILKLIKMLSKQKWLS